MKKFTAMMIALVMCLSMVAFAEEAPEITEITVERDETYVLVDLGENYAYTFMPADWLKVEAEYADEASELLGAFTNADGTAQLYVTYASIETATSYEEIYNQSVASGLISSIMIINGFEFVNVASGDDTNAVMMSTHFLDEECTQAITFTLSFPIADSAAYDPIYNQILGGLNFYEADAE